MKKIVRNALNPRHKVVWLNEKHSGKELLAYCISKGTEIDRYLTTNHLGNILFVKFYINGYYVHFEFRNPKDSKAILYYSHELLLNYAYGDFRAIAGRGVSIYND